MNYKYKLSDSMFPVPAQKAGQELERIYEKNGELKPKAVVDESRPEEAVLHPVFEWDDEIAAEKYREHQAGKLIRCVVEVVETPVTHKTIETRSFHSVEKSYHPVRVVMADEAKREELLEQCIRDMEAFKVKYSNLEHLLAPVFSQQRIAINRMRSLEQRVSP